MARRHAKARHKLKDRSAGIVSIAQRGYGFVDTPDGEFFVQKGNLHGAMDGDLVEISRLRRLESKLKQELPQCKEPQKSNSDSSGRLQMQGSVLRVLERAHKTIIGTLHFAEGLGVVVPEDRRLHFDVFLDLRAISKPAKDGDIVVVRLTTYPSKRESAQGYIEEVLGHQGELGLDIDVIIRKHDLPTNFSTAALQQAKQLAAKFNLASNSDLLSQNGGQALPGLDSQFSGLERFDLRNRHIFTIDPADAKDFDDALSLDYLDGKIRLGVHIADVSALVPWDSPIDLDARARSTSVYLPDRVIPMLPTQLSDQLCSLQPHQDRLAFTVDLLLNKDASVISAEFYQSLINSAQRLSYAQVQMALDGQVGRDIDALLLEKLQALDGLAKILAENRRQRGALDFDSTEPKLRLDAEGRPTHIELKQINAATSLVEEAMILANEVVAQYMLERDAPMIYRIHDQPLPSSLEEMLPTLQELGIAQDSAPCSSKEIQAVLDASRKIGAYELVSSLLLRTMKRARYDQGFSTHFGLASQAYTHFTSPIRRYPDLMVHRLLKLQLLKKVEKNLQGQISWISEHCSDGEYMADKASREVLKLKICEYMAGKVGVRYMATISGVNSYGFFVREISTYTEGFVSNTSLDSDFIYEPDRQRWQNPNTGKFYRLGQSLTVELASVDVAKLQIEFVVA